MAKRAESGSAEYGFTVGELQISVSHSLDFYLDIKINDVKINVLCLVLRCELWLTDWNSVDSNSDLIDRLIWDWNTERPDLELRGIGVVGRILVLARILESRVDKVLMKHGIRYTDLDVLATLRRSGAPYSMRPSDLLECVLITSGSMTACIDRLNSAGYVQRQANPDDRRSCVVKLTAPGRRLIDNAIISRFKEANNAIESLGKKESKLLEDLLRKVLANLEPDFVEED